MPTLKKIYHFLVLFSICFLHEKMGFSQDTIILLSGKEIVCSVIEINQLGVKYGIEKKRSVVENYIEQDDIFSIRYKNGREAILYTQDFSDPESFSVQETRMYITGVRDALKSYKASFVFVSGGLVGMASGLLLPPFYAPIPSVAYSLGVGWVAQPRIHRKHVFDPALLANAHYVAGYKDTAQKIHTQSVIKGSIAGVVLGIITRNMIILYNRKK